MGNGRQTLEEISAIYGPAFGPTTNRMIA